MTTPSTSVPDNTEPLDVSGSRAARKQHDAIVAWTNEQFRSIKNARLATERQWYMNLAFFFGKQNVVMQRPQTGGLGLGVSNRLWTPPAPYFRSRPVINRIRPTVLHELAKLTSQKPNASIVPASAEDRDMYAAMAGEQIWDNEYTGKKIKLVIRRAVWWMLLCGTGFIKTWWDPNCGPVGLVPDPKTGMPIEGKLGDIQYIPETPFNIFAPDLREEEIENQPFVIHATTRSPDWVKMNFPKAMNGEEVNPTSADSTELFDTSFLNLIGTRNLERQRQCLVLEVWVKPYQLPNFPNGAMFTIIDGKIVGGQGSMPFSHGKYPFAKIDHIPGGKFYGTSSIEDLLPLQKEYNRTRGQIIEAKNRMAKPQLIAPRGSVDASKITSEPGLVIQYTPGFDPPKPLPLQPLPNYVLEELDRIKIDWDDISGQHDVSKGQVPPGVTAATAISYLQERDESRMSPSFDSLEEGIEKIAQMALSYVHDYWTVERMVKVTGADGSFDVMAFKGSDLGDNLDIKVESGSSLPTSKAARQAFIMDLMKMGFIDPKEGLEVMDIGGIDKVFERIQTDQRQAQRENLRMSKVTPEDLQQYEASWMQQQMSQQMGGGQDQQVDPQASMQTQASVDPMTGQPSVQDVQSMQQPPLIIPVNTWDNHQLHILYHNQFRKGQAFENLPDFVKQIFEKHVQMHIAAMGAEMITQNPAAAAGLPPQIGAMMGQQGGPGGQQPPTGPHQMDQSIAQGDQQQNPLGNGQPGPAPMPQTSGGQ